VTAPVAIVAPAAQGDEAGSPAYIAKAEGVQRNRNGRSTWKVAIPTIAALAMIGFAVVLLQQPPLGNRTGNNAIVTSKEPEADWIKESRARREKERAESLAEFARNRHAIVAQIGQLNSVSRYEEAAALGSKYDEAEDAEFKVQRQIAEDAIARKIAAENKGLPQNDAERECMRKYPAAPVSYCKRQGLAAALVQLCKEKPWECQR
jgi:hypothetical protein